MAQHSQQQQPSGHNGNGNHNGNRPHGARPTMPIAPDDLPPDPPHRESAHGAFVLDEQAEMALRSRCRRCSGMGQLNDPHVYCAICHARWNAPDIADYQRRHHARENWRIQHLPCGDPVEMARETYTYTKCPECDGKRYIYHWTALDPLIDWVIRYIADNYDTFSQAITARRPAAM